jgi:class 3 adenylate cyclase
LVSSSHFGCRGFWCCETAGLAAHSREHRSASAILHEPEALVERRLAAILAADAAGYSRMMREDEAAALALLQKHRSEVIDPGTARRWSRELDRGYHSRRPRKCNCDSMMCTSSCVRGFASRVAVILGRMEFSRPRRRCAALRRGPPHRAYRRAQCQLAPRS